MIERADERTNEQANERTNEQTNVRANEQKNESMDEWVSVSGAAHGCCCLRDSLSMLRRSGLLLLASLPQYLARPMAWALSLKAKARKGTRWLRRTLTVAILAQGTEWAVASTQAFCVGFDSFSGQSKRNH